MKKSWSDYDQNWQCKETARGMKYRCRQCGFETLGIGPRNELHERIHEKDRQSREVSA